MNCYHRWKHSAIYPLRGERLMIVSNGVVPAAMALDELLSRNGK